MVHDPWQVALLLLSKPARSTADMPTPVRDCAPSSAGARRTARDIPDSDGVRPARATGGFRFGLPPRPVPEARTRWRRIRWSRAQSRTAICPLAADPSRPAFANRGASGILRPGAAPAVAGTRGSSIFHWVVAIPATHRQCARSPSLRGRKNSRAIWRINSSSLARNLRPQKVRDSGMS